MSQIDDDAESITCLDGFFAELGKTTRGVRVGLDVPECVGSEVDGLEESKSLVVELFQIVDAGF